MTLKLAGEEKDFVTNMKDMKTFATVSIRAGNHVGDSEGDRFPSLSEVERKGNFCVTEYLPVECVTMSIVPF